MKNIIVVYILLFATALISITGCNKLVGDINDNPNLPSDASSDLILTGMQVGLTTLHGGKLSRNVGTWSGYFKGMDRQYYGFYNYYILNSDFNGDWANVYTRVIRNSIVLEESIKKENREGIISGINKIIAAHTFGMATALWGDIPFEEAGAFIDYSNPKYDDQEIVYERIQELLDEGIEDLKSPVGRPIDKADLFFNGHPKSWERVAYSLKARFYLHAKNYDDAYKYALLGIAQPEHSWLANFDAANDAQNLYFQFYNGNRGDDLQSNETYFFDLLSPASTIYKGDDKTDENARFNYLLHQRSSDQYVNNTTSNGAFSETSPYPLFSYEENLMILAEAALRTKGFNQALSHLNELRDYYNTGNHLGSAYRSDGYKYDPYAGQDFESGGQASVPGLNKENALLRKIFEEKFIALYTQLETYNDIRRTIDDEARLPIKPNTGNKFPQRFIYPQTEIDRNQNIPSNVPDIYERTPINQ